MAPVSEKELNIDEMVKKLQRDLKEINSFEGGNKQLDFCSMNKQMDSAGSILDALEAKFNQVNASIDALLSQSEQNISQTEENNK